MNFILNTVSLALASSNRLTRETARWSASLVAILILLSAGGAAGDCPSTNVWWGLKVSGLNGTITATLNGEEAEASDEQPFCYGPSVEVLVSDGLQPNKKYSASLTWGSSCIGEKSVILSNDCSCYTLTASGTYYGDSTNGGYTGEIMLTYSNRVLFSPNPLAPDGQSTTFATPEKPAALGSNIVWSIEKPDLGCKIISTNLDTLWCLIQSGTNEGSITVTAKGSTGCEASGVLNLKKCSSCNDCEVGEGTAGLGSIDFSIKLGRADANNSAGSLGIKESAPSVDLYSARTLRYDYFSTNVHVIRDASNVLRQIRAPQVLVNIVSNSTIKYTIDLYYPTNFSTFSNGLYVVNGTPFSYFTIENPDTSGATSNQVRITETREGSSRVSDYAYTNGVWALTTGGGLRTEIETTTTNNGIRTVTREIKSATGQTVSLTTRKYQALSWGEGLIEEVRGSGPSALTNTYEYYTNGLIKQATHPNGSWEHYLYDSQWRPTNVFSAWLNQGPTTNPALCRLTEYTYSSNVVSGSGDDASYMPFVPRRVVEYVLGTEVSRRYQVQYRLSATDELLTQEIRCQTPGAAWNASHNLVTYKLYLNLTNGMFSGRTKQIVHSDRIMEFYSYSTDTNGHVTTRHQTGRGIYGDFEFYLAYGLPSDQQVGFGSETITTVDALGVVLARTNRSVYGWFRPIPATTFDTGWEVYSGFDASGRPARVDYMDGTFTLTDYGCCGVQTVTNREGTVTTYGVDALKRQVTRTATGITHRNVLDAAGNVLATVRFGTDNSFITNSSSTYDTAGQLTSTTDGLGNVTTYTNYFDGSGYRVRQTTYADGGTRIERYFRDGSLYDVSGTAAFPLTYAYGPTNDSAGRLFTVEQKSGNEWTVTVSDMRSRHYKTLHAAASAPFPYSQSFYHSISGKRIKHVDPDGNVTLFFDYDGIIDDESFYDIYSDTAVDVDRDGAIGSAGTDRITRQSLEPVENSSVFSGYNTFNRSRTTLWTTDGSGATIDASITDTSPDGLRSQQITYGLTNGTWTVYAGGGTRYVTNTAPDGTYTVNTFKDGRLVATDTLNSQLGTLNSLRYGYDSHGRQSSVTNVANGAVNTWLYDKADRVVTNTLTASGLPAQTTVNFHDNRGRIWRTLLPDGGSVTNEFYTTGLLKKTYGTRTYPVQYAYDSQGRLTNMTTWQNFAAGSGSANTTWKYDAYRGFMTNKLYADGNGTGYAYTNSGRLVKRTWARGVSTSYGYNTAGDVSVVDYSDSTTDLGYTYNRRGWPGTITHGSAATALTYGNAGNLLTESYSGGALSGLTVRNDFDSLYRRVTNSLWNGASRLAQTRYAYDAASRLFSVSDGTNSASYAYLTNTPLVSQISFTNDGALRMTTSKQFDGFYRLTNIASVGTGSTPSVASFAYQYNDANLRTRTTREDGAYWVYQYDNLGQVISGKKYWSDGTPVAGQQFEYGHDDIGNRKTVASGGDQWGANLRYEHYSANSLNQYTQRTVPGSLDVLGTANSNATVTLWSADGPSARVTTSRKAEYFRGELSFNNSTGLVHAAVTNLGVLANGANPDITTTNSGSALLVKTPEVFTHDLDGNLTSNGAWTNSWNGENRWIVAESSAAVPTAAKRKLEFAYDAYGRRIQKIVSTNNGSAWIAQSTNKFLYDGWNLIAELNGPNNAVIRSYLWGLDLSSTVHGVAGLGGLLMVNAGTNGVHFYATDGNGNAAALAQATDGGVSATYDYDPFAKSIRSTGPMAKANVFGFSTKYLDSEIESLYYGYRDCSLDMGRWSSRDPLQEQGGINVYSFVNNSSTRFGDSDGRPLLLLQPQPAILPRLILPPEVIGPGGGIGIMPPIAVVPPGAGPGPGGGPGPNPNPSPNPNPNPSPNPNPNPSPNPNPNPTPSPNPVIEPDPNSYCCFVPFDTISGIHRRWLIDCQHDGREKFGDLPDGIIPPEKQDDYDRFLKDCMRKHCVDWPPY